MSNQFSNIDFESLVEHIKQLSQTDKNKLLTILADDQFFLVTEEVASYVKTSVKDVEFEKKWDESITSDQFKVAARQHVDSLPWR